jgi:hypothetical protein
MTHDNQEPTFTDAGDALQAMHSMSDGGSIITSLEHQGRVWRGMLLGILFLHTESFKALVDSLNTATVDDPATTLHNKRLAFKLGAARVLEFCYDHPLCEQWRVVASRTVAAVDDDAFTQYRAVKYADGDNPDREQRCKAYNMIFGRFIDLSFTVAEL